jgi:hypothetical protein
MSDNDDCLLDANDNPIHVGSIVRVLQDKLKAHQVPPKAYGKFNTKKEFIPSDKNYLELPVGLVGTVTKLYTNVVNVSANYPIQVEFRPEENECYQVPSFRMHFLSSEIELVE